MVVLRNLLQVDLLNLRHHSVCLLVYQLALLEWVSQVSPNPAPLLSARWMSSRHRISDPALYRLLELTSFHLS